MSAPQIQVCTMPSKAKQELQAFTRNSSRAKEPQALIYTVDAATTTWSFVSKHEPTSMEDLTEELEVNSPRFVALIYPYKKGDLFVSPVVAVHYIPKNISPETKMLVTLAKEQFDEAVKPQATILINDDDLEDGLLTDKAVWEKKISVR